MFSGAETLGVDYVNRTKDATIVHAGYGPGKSIAEGQLINSRPELSRTYMEIGKRFLEDKSKYKELNGINAEEYLEKARAMFKEMDLQWDLDELDKITSHV